MDSAETLFVGGPLDGQTKRVPCPGEPVVCVAKSEIISETLLKASVRLGLVPASMERHRYAPLWIDPANKTPTIYAHERLSPAEAISKLIAGYKV